VSSRTTVVNLLALAALTGCAPTVPLDERPCPCLIDEGYVCCPSLGRCVREGACTGGAEPDGQAPERSDAPSPDAAPPLADDKCGAVQAPFELAGEVVDFQVNRLGLLVALRDELRLLSRRGPLRTRVALPHALTAVAFGAGRTVIADATQLIAYDEGLEERARVPLAEPCRSLALAGATALCSTGAGGRRLSLYDLAEARAIGQHELDGLGSISVVPGLPFFVSVDEAHGPPALTLFKLGATVESYGRAPAGQPGDLTHGLGFAGIPTTNVVTSDGYLLSIFGPGCDPGVTPLAGGTACLHQLGRLGPIQSPGRFSGIDPEAARTVYAGWGPEDPENAEERSGFAAAFDAGTGALTFFLGHQVTLNPRAVRFRHDALCATGVSAYAVGGISYLDPWAMSFIDPGYGTRAQLPASPPRAGLRVEGHHARGGVETPRSMTIVLGGRGLWRRTGWRTRRERGLSGRSRPPRW
jgi:hypothetical protein